MRKKRYPLVIAIIVLVLVILAANIIFDFKLSFNRSVASVFNSFAPEGELERQILLLQKENADLKAQLFQEKVIPQDVAIVYSSYPFNNKSEIVISWGLNDGVSVGDTVTYGNNILIGQVSAVTTKNSVVETIFDPGFETAVRIGTAGVDALIRGGNELILDFIPDDAQIEVGDKVITASKELPYGLEIGEVKEVRTKGGSVFKSATVKASFEIKTLRDVNVLR